MNDSEKICLLMTATISPRNCPDAQFSPEERKRRYLTAFQYYIDRIGVAGYDYIVFVENSGVDLSDFERVIPNNVRDDVEVLSAPPGIFPVHLGKNNEFNLIDYAIDYSKKLHEEIAGFFKVTGRYYFRNIASLLRDVRRAGMGLQLYCDQKDHRLYSRLGIGKEESDGETRFFFSSLAFWRENFYGYFKRYPKWRRVEDIMFETAVRNYGNQNCRFRFRHQPLLGGNSFSGAQGGYIISMGIKMPPRIFFAVCHFRWLVESALRVLLPSFWF